MRRNVQQTGFTANCDDECSSHCEDSYDTTTYFFDLAKTTKLILQQYRTNMKGGCIRSYCSPTVNCIMKCQICSSHFWGLLKPVSTLLPRYSLISATATVALRWCFCERAHWLTPGRLTPPLLPCPVPALCNHSNTHVHNKPNAHHVNYTTKSLTHFHPTVQLIWLAKTRERYEEIVVKVVNYCSKTILPHTVNIVTWENVTRSSYDSFSCCTMKNSLNTSLPTDTQNLHNCIYWNMSWYRR